MTYVPFCKNQEKKFDNWVKSHPFGLVVNSSPGHLNAAYVKAHRPACRSIHEHPGATTVYSKHCFDSAAEAIEYLATNYKATPSFGCPRCKVSALQPTCDPKLLEASVAVLLAGSFDSAPAGNRHPQRVTVSSTTLVQRDPTVVAWVLREAHGKCELCRADAPFLTGAGRPYLEVHHVRTLAMGGPDTVDNAVALCPNCHRSMHYSNLTDALLDRIYGRIPRLVR